MTGLRMLTLVAAATALWLSGNARAEEFKLPTAAELNGFSPAAQKFYQAGMAAVDRTDYVNGYNYLAKAAQLQPTAVRLNNIVAGIALKHGRNVPAAEAKDYYETAVVSYRSILAQPSLSPEVRREVVNKLKIALDEQSTLAQRDVKREAIGTLFINTYSREIASPTPTPKGAVAAAGPPAAYGAPTALGTVAPISGQLAPLGGNAVLGGPPSLPSGLPTLGGLPSLPGPAQPASGAPVGEAENRP